MRDDTKAIPGALSGRMETSESPLCGRRRYTRASADAGSAWGRHWVLCPTAIDLVATDSLLAHL